MPHRHPPLFYFKPFKLCDMNFSRISRSSKTALITLGICSLLLGCEDSPFYDRSGSDSPYPVFNVSVMSGWTAGTRVTRNGDTEVLIDEINSIGEEKLYLISEITEINDSLMSGVSGPSTRGERVTTTDKLKEKFGTDFGLYAVCYSGSSEKTDWTNAGDVTPNVADNLKMSWSTETETASDKTLFWTGEGRMRFMAYAPYDENGEHYGIKSKWEDRSKGLEFTVNDEIKKQVDLLIAYEDCPGDHRKDVNLSFGHALSAISFKTGEMLAGKITKIEVSGIYGSGTLNLLTNTWTATGNKKSFIMSSGTDQELGENGIELGSKDHDNPYTEGGNLIAGGEITGSEGNTIDDCLTLFMIPQELTDAAKVTVTFKDDISGGASERTLTYSIGGTYNNEGATVNKKWEAGKLYSYSLSTNGIVITPVVEIGGIREYESNSSTPNDINSKYKYNVPYTGVLKDVNIKAYLKIDQAGQNTVYKPGNYEVKYAIGNSNPTNARIIDDEKFAVTEETAGEPAPESKTILLGEQSEYSKMKLNGTDNGGSKDNPKDLSNGGETANCYMIVEKYGWFKFPMYYGNARGSSGEENKSSFMIHRSAPAGTTPDAGMIFFVDGNNQEIENGNIIIDQSNKSKDLSKAKAILLWQDSPGLIDNVEFVYSEENSEDSYIRFKVDKETLAQGNAVIALVDGGNKGSDTDNSKGDVVWSWHIWVTNKNWSTTYNFFEKDNIGANTTISHDFAPSVLGYCDPHGENAKRELAISIEFNTTNYAGTKIVVNKFKKDDNGVYKYDETGSGLTLIQDAIDASIAGDNTYYQWGRSVPFVGGIYANNTEICYPFNTNKNNNGEFTMRNKRIFDWDEGSDSGNHPYKFGRAINKDGAINDGLSLGDAIKHPQWFPMGDETQHGDKKVKYREHWHNYSKTDSHGVPSTYMDNGGTMYNAWNSTAYKVGHSYSAGDQLIANPLNGQQVTKTIYDPSPAGFCVPSANAYTAFVNVSNDYNGDSRYNKNSDLNWIESNREWKISENIKIHATGMRDMNIKDTQKTLLDSKLNNSTWPAFRMITYIASSTLDDSGNNTGTPQVLIFYLDRRSRSDKENEFTDNSIKCGCCYPSRNTYGMTIWPVKIK